MKFTSDTFYLVQQNSINLTHKGPDRCQIIGYQIIRWYLYWPKFIQVMFFYCLGCTTNQTRIPIGYLFDLLVQGHQGPLLFFSGVFVAEEVDWVGDQESGDTTTVDVQTLLEAFLNMSLRSACLIDEFFSGKK
jgi:hypothetical protein